MATLSTNYFSTLYPDNKKSPAKSKILWFTNSLLFLKPSLFKFLPSTTTALSNEPPFARPVFLYFQYLRTNKKF